VAISPVTVVAN